MIAYGGGAPLHANRLCEKLGISTFLVPPGAGVGAAIGFLRAPFGYEAVQGGYMRLSQFDAGRVADILNALQSESVAVARVGDPDGQLEIEIRAYMRYHGQGWEIPVDLPAKGFEKPDSEQLKTLFETEYQRLFGAVLAGLDIEVMNWSVRATSPASPVRKIAETKRKSDAKIICNRPIFDPHTAKFMDAAIVERPALKTGDAVIGPAAIVDDHRVSRIPLCHAIRRLPQDHPN